MDLAKFSKKPKVYFHVNYSTGSDNSCSDDTGTVSLGPGLLTAILLLKGKSYVFHCKLWPIYNPKTICIVTDESCDSIHIQITLQLTVPILDKNQICKHNLIPGPSYPHQDLLQSLQS